MKAFALTVSCLLLASCHAPHENGIRREAAVDTTADTVRIKTEQTQNVANLHKAPADVYTRFFNDGIRLEATGGENAPMYIRFTDDSLRAEIFTPENNTCQVLAQRVLPSGARTWNAGDDDTKNLQYADHCWTVSQHGKLVAKQPQGDNDTRLGAWQNICYEGILPDGGRPGIKYQLYIRHRKHSGDGNFLLRTTHPEAENGQYAVYNYMGKRITQRGTPDNPDAIVWQLVPDNGKNIYNFLYDAESQTLTPLNSQFETINAAASGHVLKKTD